MKSWHALRFPWEVIASVSIGSESFPAGGRHATKAGEFRQSTESQRFRVAISVMGCPSLSGVSKPLPRAAPCAPATVTRPPTPHPCIWIRSTGYAFLVDARQHGSPPRPVSVATVSRHNYGSGEKGPHGGFGRRGTGAERRIAQRLLHLLPLGGTQLPGLVLRATHECRRATSHSRRPTLRRTPTRCPCHSPTTTRRRRSRGPTYHRHGAAGPHPKAWLAAKAGECGRSAHLSGFVSTTAQTRTWRTRYRARGRAHTHTLCCGGPVIAVSA